MQDPQETLQSHQEQLVKLRKKFNRYFVFTKADTKQSGFSGFGRAFLNDGRDSLSTIIDGQVYLGPISMCRKFIQENSKAKGGLVVSCCDISELAGSGLLEEPESKTIKYHVLAMEDVTAQVGSVDQIHHALTQMQIVTEQEKPILIHCYSGVGRSPMMTVLHIAHRYLLRDSDIKSLIEGFNNNSRQPILLNPEDEHYVENLYQVVKSYVKSRRSCCQFDRQDRYALAIQVLKTLHQQGQKVIDAADQNYQFLAELTQSLEFKSLQRYCISSLSWHDRLIIYAPKTNENDELERPRVLSTIDPQKCIMTFFKSFIINESLWYQHLINATKDEQSELNNTNPLYQFCNTIVETTAENKLSIKANRRELVSGLLNVIDRLASKYPQALFSQSVATHKDKLIVTNTAPHFKP